MAAALFARAVGLAWMLVLFGIKCLTAAPVPSATVTGNSLLGNPGVPRDVLAARTAGAGSCASRAMGGGSSAQAPHPRASIDAQPCVHVLGLRRNSVSRSLHG